MNRLPENLLILVCDSRKALFLRNVGSPIKPQLEILFHDEADDAPTDAEDSGAAGRRFDGGAAGGSFHSRSAMEQRDLQEQHAMAFAGQIDKHLQDLNARTPIDEIAVAAPPAFLGVLRGELSSEVSRKITSQTPKRLTDRHVDEIAAAFVDFSKVDK